MELSWFIFHMIHCLYIETTDFFMRLYPITLFNLFISTNRGFFFGEVFKIFDIWDQSICRQRQFYCFLSDGMLFISFPCLMVLAGISKLMLNRSGEGGHFYRVPDLREEVFNISPPKPMDELVCSDIRRKH